MRIEPRKVCLRTQGMKETRKSLETLQIKRDEGGEAAAVGGAHVILQIVVDGKREAGVPIEQRADDEPLGKLEAPPGHDAVGDVGGKRAEKIGLNNRPLVGNVDGGHGVQIAARLRC